MTPTDPDGDSEEDSWKTDEEPGRDLIPLDQSFRSLRDTLKDAHLTTRDAEEERHQIPVRFLPPGFRAVLDQLAHEEQTSFSRLTRHALDLGIEILDAQPWIRTLRHAYYDNRAVAMATGDPEALARLNQPQRYDFRGQQPFRTTFAVSRTTIARVAELARVCGIHPPAMAVVTVIVSILTLPNNRGYRSGLIYEVGAFQRFVVRRTRVLRME